MFIMTRKMKVIENSELIADKRKNFDVILQVVSSHAHMRSLEQLETARFRLFYQKFGILVRTNKNRFFVVASVQARCKKCNENRVK